MRVVETSVDSEVIPVDVDDERLVRLLLVMLRPVDTEVKPVDRELRPVDSEFTPLCAVLRPVEVDVDRLVTLLLVVLRPVDNEPAPVDRLLTVLLVVLKPVDSEFTPLCAVLSPVEVDVDSELTPVERLASRLTAVLSPVEVDVDRLVTLLLVVLRPVDRLLIVVPKLPTAWFVAYNSLPLIASVLLAEIRPAATLVIVRSAPTEPTLTVLPGVVPAKL